MTGTPSLTPRTRSAWRALRAFLAVQVELHGTRLPPGHHRVGWCPG